MVLTGLFALTRDEQKKLIDSKKMSSNENGKNAKDTKVKGKKGK